MTDPIETALDAWFGDGRWRDFIDRSPSEMIAKMCTAIAAADKVRADELRKDMPPEATFAQEAESLFDAAFNNMGWKPIQSSLMRCFAAGLAKGVADRAAMVAALEFIADKNNSDVPTKRTAVGHLQSVAEAALALVRKGV